MIMTDPAANNWHELLPWYVNGTLPADECRQLEAAMAQDSSLQEELVWLQQLRTSVQQLEQPVPVGELGWQRLKRDIRRDKSKVWKRWGVGAATAATVLLSVQMGMLIKPDQRPIQVMSADGTVQNLEGYWRVQLGFASDATMADVQQWAAVHGLRIVDGPSAIGLYLVLIPQSEFATLPLLEDWLQQQPLLEHSAVME